MLRFSVTATATLLTTLAATVLAPAAQAACQTYKHRAKIESQPFGTDLAYLSIALRACYNGRRITKAGSLDITPSYTSNALGSMGFQGVEPEPITEYRVWRGRKKGSYYVKAGGNFVQQAVGFEGKTTYIWVSMKVLANGVAVLDRKNG